MYKKINKKEKKLYIFIKQMSFVNKKIFLLIKDICSIKIYKFYELFMKRMFPDPTTWTWLYFRVFFFM